MRVTYATELAESEAKERLLALGEYLSNRHGINVVWNGNSATFDGKYMLVKIAGELTLSADGVTFEGKDPGRLLRNRAQDYLEKKLKMYLDTSTPVADLPRGT